MTDFFQRTLSLDNNPILDKPDIPHILKLNILCRIRDLIVTSRPIDGNEIEFTKIYQLCIINLWENNIIGFDERNKFKKLYNHFHAENRLREMFTEVSLGRENKFAWNYRIKDYSEIIIEYFMLLEEKSAGSSNSELIRLKVLSICEKMGIKVDDQNNIIENLNKIEQAAGDLVGVQSLNKQ
jgi:hypothetical protein